MLDVLQLPFAQRGLLAVALLCVGAGLVGTWIVLRGLAFYSHAVGTATFPGLVLADGLGFGASLGAAGTAALVAVGVGALARSDRARDRYDSLTALVLVGALALGIVLASDVFGSQAGVESLLFGSLLLIGPGDLWLMGGASALALVAGILLEHRWVLTGFDPGAARSLGVRSGASDLVLLAVVAALAVAVLAAVGALLATALLVVPAATTRLVCSRLRSWQAATIALVALEGWAGVWLSIETNAPTGATIAVLSAGVFALVALLARVLHGRRAVALAGAAALAAGVGACGSGPSASGPGRLRVTASTTQLGDFARAVGGDRVRVTQLLQPNSDPHDYEPRPRDITATADAQVVLESGDGLDRWMGAVVDESGTDGAVVDAGAGRPDVVQRTADSEEGSAGTPDPHWWADPQNAEHAVAVIRDAYARADPAAAPAFRANAARYVARVRATDRALTRCIDAVPAAQRTLVTDHDAFAYFVRHFHIAYVGAVIPSSTTQAQPSAGDVAALAATVRARGVRTIFPESSLNPKLAEAIARQTGARVGGTLYADTLGAAGSAGATYLGAMVHNADAMVRGFTGGKRGCAT